MYIYIYIYINGCHCQCAYLFVEIQCLYHIIGSFFLSTNLFRTSYQLTIALRSGFRRRWWS